MRLQQAVYKTIGVVILLLVFPLYPARAFQNDTIDPLASTIGVVPSVGVFWSSQHGMGFIGDVSGSFLVLNSSLEYTYAFDAQQSAGRIYGGLGIGLYLQAQIGFGDGGWNTRGSIGIPLKSKTDQWWMLHGDPVLSLFGGLGPGLDWRGGVMLGVFLDAAELNRKW